MYACWLTQIGYRVHLRDLLPLHVDLARQAAATQLGRPFESAEVGDARRVNLPSESVDAALPLGPLYHLPERQDRLQAIAEAKRVLRPAGVAFVVGISRFASLQDGLHEGFLDDPTFAAIMEEDVRTGQHRNPTNHPAYFTTAYFHHPAELQAEVREAGLEVLSCLAVEGPVGLIPDFDSWWTAPHRRERLLAAIRLVEKEPALLGISSHVMVVARKNSAGSGGHGADGR